MRPPARIASTCHVLRHDRAAAFARNVIAALEGPVQDIAFLDAIVVGPDGEATARRRN